MVTVNLLFIKSVQFFKSHQFYLCEIINILKILKPLIIKVTYLLAEKQYIFQYFFVGTTFFVCIES